MLTRKKRKRKRHWYIVQQKRGGTIKFLFSAKTKLSIKKELRLGKSDNSVIIEKAKRWHIAKVFSGLPIFYDYVRDDFSAFKYEDVEAHVVNEFKMLLEDDPMSVNNAPLAHEKILVKILD